MNSGPIKNLLEPVQVIHNFTAQSSFPGRASPAQLFDDMPDKRGASGSVSDSPRGRDKVRAVDDSKSTESASGYVDDEIDNQVTSPAVRIGTPVHDPNRPQLVRDVDSQS